MKKLIFTSILCLIFGISQSQNKTYQITGTVTDAKEGTVILEKYLNNGTIATDSTKFSKGNFIFEGSVDSPIAAGLTLKSGNSTKRVSFFVENSKMTVKVNMNANSAVYEVKGSKTNDEFRSFLENCKSNKPYQEEIDCQKQQINKHVNSLFVPYVLYATMLYYYDYEELRKTINNFSGEATKTYHYIKLKEYADRLSRVAIGQIAPDISQPDLNGKNESFQPLLKNNKYILIDFWASWCRPCRQENPHVLEAYNAYHAKGFDVFGVSFDKDKDKWQKAIEDDKLPWHHVSELKMWDNKAAEIYCVRSIPANYLIDQNGKIIAHNLRGEELKNKLKELFGE